MVAGRKRDGTALELARAALIRVSGSRLARVARDARGVTMTELVVAIVVIAILVSLAMPTAVGYVTAARVRWGAREVQNGLTRARLLAVSTRQSICIDLAAGGIGYLLRQGGCAGTAWIGSGTNGAGVFAVSNTVTLANTGTRPVFTPFGTASQTGTLTVTVTGGQPVTVTVRPSGNVTSP
jgi:prepilin-type N-terminal cleavage/methylation domain-containing protein